MGNKNLRKYSFSILPTPNNIELIGGRFTVGKIVVINEIKESSEAKMFIEKHLSDFHKDSKHSIALSFLQDKLLEAENYSIKAERDTIKIFANEKSGFYYAAITIWQIFFLNSELHEFPAFYISDKPFYKWRGMHLDESRHFFGKDFVLKWIEFLSIYKINRFHWHLTDDNGWRIEMKSYPKLQEIASKRIDREHLKWKDRDFPVRDDESKLYTGFYTQEDIREIVQFAENKNIIIIPEIEMPGHSLEVFAAYPEFSCKKIKTNVASGINWPGKDIFCAGNEKTYSFLKNIITEIAELFSGDYLHLGGDEVCMDYWKECPTCQAKMKQLNVVSEKELQAHFMQEMIQFTKRLGKKPIVWDDVLDSSPVGDFIAMCWRKNGEMGYEKANHRKVIMCPNDTLYFDWKQEDKKNAKGAFGVTDLKKVYHYQPRMENVLGIQGNVWSEFMSNPKEVEYMSVPRMLALAENAWNKVEKHDWRMFSSKLFHHKKIFEKFKIKYFSEPEIWG